MVTYSRRTATLEPIRWLLLHYRVPPEPSARRVYVWRKLKRLGAILLHHSVWVLPDTPRCREQFQWIAAEILEMGGEALFWEARLVLGTPDEALVQSFLDQADRAYRSILRQLAKKEDDLPSLSQQYQQVQQQDYFHSEVGTRVREALIAARGGSGI